MCDWCVCDGVCVMCVVDCVCVCVGLCVCVVCCGVCCVWVCGVCCVNLYFNIISSENQLHFIMYIFFKRFICVS